MAQFNSLVSAASDRSFLGITVLDMDYDIPFVAGDNIKIVCPMPAEGMTIESVQIRHIDGAPTNATSTWPTYTLNVVNMGGHGSGGYSMLNGNAPYDLTSGSGLHANQWLNIPISGTAGDQHNGTGILTGRPAAITLDMSGDWSSAGTLPKGVHLSIKWSVT